MNASLLQTAPCILRGELLPVELTIHDHYGRETRVVLGRLPAIIGRDECADVPLIDPWISRRHCEIDRIGDVLVVRDLDSKNGIFMYGHRVNEWHVPPGERFTIGQTEIVARYAEGAIEDEAIEQQKQGPSRNCTRDTAELLY